MASEQQRRPWERQKGEGRRPAEGLAIYISLGPARSLQAAWEQYYQTPHQAEKRRRAGKTDKLPGNPPGYWTAWSVKWRWPARAEEHDAYHRALADQHMADLAIEEADKRAAARAEQKELIEKEAVALRAVARILTQRILQVVGNPATLQQVGLRRVKERSGDKTSYTEEITPGILDLVKLAADGLDVGSRLYRMAMGEVTERGAVQVEGDGLAVALAQEILAELRAQRVNGDL